MEKETHQNIILKEQIKRLEEEIKFLRELVNKLVNNSETTITIQKEVEKPNYNPYLTWTGYNTTTY